MNDAMWVILELLLTFLAGGLAGWEVREITQRVRSGRKAEGDKS